MHALMVLSLPSAPDLYDSLSEDYIVERLQEQMLPAEEFSRIREGIRDALTAASGSWW